MNGDLELELAQEILRKVNVNYPVSLNALWVEPDDCQFGVRVCRKLQSQVPSDFHVPHRGPAYLKTAMP